MIGDIKYITRDSVYFKKINEKSWSDPGKVLGQDWQKGFGKIWPQLCKSPSMPTVIS